MFDYLNATDDMTLTSVVYEAGLVLYERELHRNGPALPALRGSSRHTAQVIRLVHRVLQEIEAEEGMRFTDLPPELYEKYLRILSGIAEERRRSRPGFDPERGQRLLEELRRDYYPSAA